MEYLAKAFKNAAHTLCPESDRQYYLEDNEDYRDGVYRITDVSILDCWYGFIHVQNNS